MSVLKLICFFDPPQLIDTSVTPIPASASPTLQVIADSGVERGIGISYKDTTGDFIGVYIGAIGFEQLICIIGNGDTSTAWCTVPQHSRVSLRSLKNAAITTGLLSGELVTKL
jgi:hypothetical protein